MITELEKEEFKRQDEVLNFIASENYPSEKILEANGSLFVSKYAEGFAGKRFYNGCQIVDKLEEQCMKECLNAFSADHSKYMANVQMTSGCMANITVYHALLEKGDIILAPDTASLGHISHGVRGSFLDTYFDVVKYGLNDSTGEIDYDKVEELALEHKPKLIICGASNYSQIVNFKRFRDIANKCGALLMADVSHIAGLICGGKHPTPVGFADIITTTLHKTLKGVRGAVIIYKKEFDKQMKYATIPGLWGGSHLNNTLAKLQTFLEVQTPDFLDYIERVVQNTQVMADTFNRFDIPLVSGGTKNHVFCLDLRKYNLSGKHLANILEECGVITNCNAVPKDTSFINPSGLRIGGAPATARGLDKDDVKRIALGIASIILYFEDKENEDTCIFENLKQQLKVIVKDITLRHPLKDIYPNTYKRLFEVEENV